MYYKSSSTDNNEKDKVVTLEIRHNSFRIYPYKLAKYDKETGRNTGTCPKLDRAFTNFDYFRKRWKLKLNIYNKATKSLVLPIGVGIDFIKEKLDENYVFYNIIDNSDTYVKPREISVNLYDKTVIRDRFQAESIDFLTSKSLLHAKMLALYTGRGKTFCAISAIYRLKEAALIISPTLADQWCEKISEYTNCNIDNGGIVMIRGTEKLHKVLNKPREKHRAVFYISTSSTLSKYIENYGTLNEIGERLGIGIKCFDEFHMYYSQNVSIDCNLETEFTFYLTATPDRTDYNEKKIFKNLFHKIPVYGLETFKIDNYFNIRCVDYDTNPTEYEIQKCMTEKGFSGILYWNYIFNNPERKMYMIGMLKMLIDQLLEKDPDIKVLIYLAKLEHIKEFKRILESIYDNSGLKFGNYTTAVKKENKRREIKNNIIFTTLGSGSVGLDVDKLIASFSLVPFSSNITASQAMGRVRKIENDEVYYYDFVDKGFKSMDTQREKRMMIFKVKSKTITKKFISYDDIKRYLFN